MEALAQRRLPPLFRFHDRHHSGAGPDEQCIDGMAVTIATLPHSERSPVEPVRQRYGVVCGTTCPI